MSRHLFDVQSATIIEKRGIVLFPGLSPDQMLHGATQVELRLPNGGSVVARIAGMAHFGRKPGEPSPLLIARAPPDLEVPPGTEVWTAPG